MFEFENTLKCVVEGNVYSNNTIMNYGADLKSISERESNKNNITIHCGDKKSEKRFHNHFNGFLNVQ